jgi:hypothetical protein
MSTQAHLAARSLQLTRWANSPEKIARPMFPVAPWKCMIAPNANGKAHSFSAARIALMAVFQRSAIHLRH